MNGWLATAALITGYDVYQHLRKGESMSACWWRWSRTPAGRVLCTTAWLAITAHLLFEIPNRKEA